MTELIIKGFENRMSKEIKAVFTTETFYPLEDLIRHKDIHLKRQIKV